MKDLRLYITPEASMVGSLNLTFYSRRAGGPYYRWRYEKVCERWLAYRMRANELTEIELVAASRQDVPVALRLSLSEHYQE